MAIDWDRVRYRGDAADVKELFETYRVEDYLETAERARGEQKQGLREWLLHEGVRLSERVSPRIFAIYGAVRSTLGLGEAEVFCVQAGEVNAFAAVDESASGSHNLVGVTSSALEHLEDAELRFLLGHELGHIVLGNNRLTALQNPNPETPAATVLPPLGESLYLRWKKKAEVSVDRVGLLACGDFATAARALLKATFGLSERNLNLDVASLLSQIDDLAGKGVLIRDAFASHPLLPIRLKALEHFARSEKAKAAGFPTRGRLLSDDALERRVDALMDLTRRHPSDPLEVAVMQAIAWGGALVLGADGDISTDEVKLLIQMLHQTFTDAPETVILTDRKKVEKRLPKVLAEVVKSGDDRVKGWLLSRLCDLALADGALLDVEGKVIHEIAQTLKIPAPVTHGMMVEAAQSNGFGADVRLSEIAENLRRSFKQGLYSARRSRRFPTPSPDAPSRPR